MTRQERDNYIKLHPEMTAKQLAKHLHVGHATVERVRASQRPKETPPTDDVITNLRQQQTQLREMLRIVPPDSETYRKAVNDIPR